MEKFIELTKKLLAAGEEYIKTASELETSMDELNKDKTQILFYLSQHPEAKELVEQLDEQQLKLINVIL